MDLEHGSLNQVDNDEVTIVLSVQPVLPFCLTLLILRSGRIGVLLRDNSLTDLEL